MANQFSAPGIMIDDTYIDNIDKAIDLLWMRRDEHKGVLEKYFEKFTPTGGRSVKISSVSSVVGLPVENEDTEELPYVQPAPGLDKTFTMVLYRSGIRVTRTMLETDRFNRIVSMAGGLVKSGMRKMEYLRVAIFNTALTGTAGADSLPLCDDSHPHENPEAGTWDNEGTGALTGSNLQALCLLAAKMTNEKGYPDPVMPVDLVVPPDLKQKALELTRSPKRAEDALNAETQIIDTLNVVVSPFLSSTTAYYVIGDRTGEDKGLHEIALSPFSMANNSPANVDIMIDKRIRGMLTVGYTVSKNVFASAGT